MAKKPKLKLETIKRVLVEWIDADASVGWDDHDHAKANICHTVGYIVYEDDVRLSVAGSVDFINDQSNCVVSIPKVCIKKKRNI